MLYINEEQVRDLLPMEECIEELRKAFQALALGDAQNQPRRRMFVEGGSVLHALAGSYDLYFGTKVYATNLKHGAHFYVLLFDSATARPLAQIDANYLGQIRTGAASGLAVDVLAKPEAATLGVIGSGFQARSQIDAIRLVRPITTIRAWSRNTEKLEAFARETGAIPMLNAREAVDGADIVVTATSAKEPVFEYEWLKRDVVVCAMGSNNAKRRELPSELIRRARVIVDDIEQAKIEAGDILLAGLPNWEESVGQLADYVAGKSHADYRGQQVFKSLGLGLEDIAAAKIVYEKAAGK